MDSLEECEKEFVYYLLFIVVKIHFASVNAYIALNLIYNWTLKVVYIMK